MPEIEINVNEIAGHAAAELVESFFASVGDTTRDKIAKYKVRFGRGFSRYLTETLTRYSQYKTLINRHESIDLGENYVPARVGDGDAVYRSDDFFEQLTERKRFIVEGTAGLGKTLFIRHMLRHTVLYEKRYIPILFELRHLHLDNSRSLTANLVKQVADYVPGFTDEHLRFGMESGKFVIYLDGIDEISLADRTRYAAEILDMAYRFGETPILLSTRPDDFYIPWEVFRVVKLLPMKRDQTVLMLSKLTFDAEIKESFTRNITPEFFAEHEEFLSIPLLATLMMLTYSEFAAVPDKMHVFYEQAFQTLFHKHDFIKGAYSRTIECGLDVERFRQALAAFCFISYLEERFSFLQFQVIEDINAALALARIEADTEALLKDLLVTVCLLQRDGNYITFIHRSFQEYFAAYFISKCPQEEVFSIMEALVSRGKVDNVVRMVIQLADGIVEREWVIPKLAEAINVFDERDIDFKLVHSVFGTPYFKRGLTFARQGKIDMDSIRIILGEYSTANRDRTDVFVDDARLLATYLDEQQALSDKQMPHNRSAIGARKRESLGAGLNLLVFPETQVGELRCIREAAEDLRQLTEIKTMLEEKQTARAVGIKGILDRIKKT